MPFIDDTAIIGSGRPRVSFVVTSRNDDHGGSMLRRFRMFAEGLLRLAAKYRLSGELIVVEWNPPPGKRLHEELQLDAQPENFAVRFIEVAPELHRRFRNADVIPLFQYIAKNVGIRRARGQFILATNPDLLFSESLIEFLATGDLEQAALYRIDRSDVPAYVPDGLSTEEQLAWCAKHILRVHHKLGTFEGDLWSSRLYRMRMFLSQSAVIKNLVRRFFKGRRLVRRGIALLQGQAQLLPPAPHLHTNACGDFTLAARHQWHRLRGYPEMPIWSMHLDSLLCYLAAALGLPEHVLRQPHRVYHLEHASSWVVMTAEERLRTFATKPWIDWHLLQEARSYMHANARVIGLNEDNWGLAQHELSEVVFLEGAERTVRLPSTVLQKA